MTQGPCFPEIKRNWPWKETTCKDDVFFFSCTFAIVLQAYHVIHMGVGEKTASHSATELATGTLPSYKKTISSCATVKFEQLQYSRVVL